MKRGEYCRLVTASLGAYEKHRGAIPAYARNTRLAYLLLRLEG